jgi:hypothetical protein
VAPLRHDEDGSETRVTTEERFERIERGTQRNSTVWGSILEAAARDRASHERSRETDQRFPIRMRAFRFRRWSRLWASSCGT